MEYNSIPDPSGWPFIGNFLDISDPEGPISGLHHLAEIYGPVFRLKLFGNRQLVISDAKIMKEVLNEKRFLKTAIPGLADPDKPSGLIVAGTLVPDWEQGHRILSPAFGPIKIQEMFEGMKDVA